MCILNKLGFKKYNIIAQFDQYDSISARAIGEGEKTAEYYCPSLIHAVSVLNLSLQNQNKSMWACEVTNEKGEKFSLNRKDIVWCLKRYQDDKKILLI